MLLAVFILAHSWYPQECCYGGKEDGDCHPVPCDQITETAKDYVWKGFHFQPEQVRPSLDQFCHVCIGRRYDNGEPVGEPQFPHCMFIRPTS